MRILTFRSILATAGLCMAVMMTGIAPVHAQVPLDNPLELDGNAVDDTGPAGFDWSNFLAQPFTKSFIIDKVNNDTDDNFFKGGSKDERDISAAGITQNYWLNTPTTPPDKDDIEHAFVINTLVNGEQVIYFGADRLSNSGDSAIGFWFFKSKISENPDGTFSGVHSVGDVLITSDFRKGGSASVINVFEWVGGSSPLLLKASTTTGGGSLINGVFCTTGQTVCATANSSPVAVPTVFQPYIFKESGVSTVTTYPIGTFFEGGINIKDIFGSNQCFASFLAMTRTSASTTAQLKDFALGDFKVCSINTEKVCAPSLENAPNPVVNPDGSTVHTKFNVTITNDGGGPLADIRVKEDFTRTAGGVKVFPVTGDICKITAITGDAINPPVGSLPITLIDSSGTKGEKKVSDSLDVAKTISLTVECDTKFNGLANQIEVISGSSAGESDVKDLDIMTDAEVCKATVAPGIEVTKDCKTVTLVGGVKPKVCVDITVKSTTTEDLIDVTVTDPLLSASPIFSGSLEPKEAKSLGTFCYEPTASDGDPAETDPEKITYTNLVTAKGTGAVSSQDASDTDTATCKLCPPPQSTSN